MDRLTDEELKETLKRYAMLDNVLNLGRSDDMAYRGLLELQARRAAEREEAPKETLAEERLVALFHMLEPEEDGSLQLIKSAEAELEMALAELLHHRAAAYLRQGQERAHAAQVADLQRQLAEALMENERLRRERADALAVTTREGLTASEWLLRTGKAEREAREALADNAALLAYARELEATVPTGVKSEWRWRAWVPIEGDHHPCAALLEAHRAEADALRASNAALLEALRSARDPHSSGECSAGACSCGAIAALDAPCTGATLLERHRAEVDVLRADNAALLRFAKDVREACLTGLWTTFISKEAVRLLATEHPGAALLAESDRLREALHVIGYGLHLEREPYELARAALEGGT